MLITVDLNRCENHGQCVFAAPEVFHFDEEEILRHDATPEGVPLARVEQAAALCPVRAITVRPDAER